MLGVSCGPPGRSHQWFADHRLSHCWSNRLIWSIWPILANSDQSGQFWWSDPVASDWKSSGAISSIKQINKYVSIRLKELFGDEINEWMNIWMTESKPANDGEWMNVYVCMYAHLHKRITDRLTNYMWLGIQMNELANNEWMNEWMDLSMYACIWKIRRLAFWPP